MYLSHRVVEIAMTLRNVPECQAQFKKSDGTSFSLPSLCSFSLLVSYSVSAASSREPLDEVVGCSPLISLALLLSYCVTTSSPVSSSKNEFTFLWNGDIIFLFCYIAPGLALLVIKLCLKHLGSSNTTCTQMLAFLHFSITTQLTFHQLNQLLTRCQLWRNGREPWCLLYRTTAAWFSINNPGIPKSQTFPADGMRVCENIKYLC